MHVRTQVQEVCFKICVPFEHSTIGVRCSFCYLFVLFFLFSLYFLLVSKCSLHGKKVVLAYYDSSKELNERCVIFSVRKGKWDLIKERVDK